MIPRIAIRMWYGWKLRSPKPRDLKFYERLWCGSPRIYIGPVGASAILHAEARAFEQVVADGAISDAELAQGLTHVDATFAGYCFEVLVARNSPRLDNLPAALYERTELVAMGLGCFLNYLPLGEYIRGRVAAEKKRRSKPLL